MQTLVIVNTEQFGYNSCTYYYCKYLRDRYDITYIGWDHGLKKITIPRIHIVYVPRSGGPLRIFNFLQTVLRYTKSRKIIILIKYFKVVCTILRMLRARNPLVLDIRTGSIAPGRLRRFLQDALLKFESLFFRNITVISRGLSTRLGLDDRCFLLPLGADIISHTKKKFDELKLLYVGTLYNRNLNRAVEGFARFHASAPHAEKASFTIIGAGLKNEVDELKEIVRRHNLQSSVHILGGIPHDQLKGYFNSHNVGVSYIPMTDYYDVQPPTKTFEYLLSGLVVIGTATSENRLVINESNGILTGDSADEFCDGLNRLVARIGSFDSNRIRQGAQSFTWKKITDELDGYLKSLQTGK